MIILYSKGDKVTYNSGLGSPEPDIVKRVESDLVWVVYHCNEEWSRYEDYTAALTPLTFLTPGWA